MILLHTALLDLVIVVLWQLQTDSGCFDIFSPEFESANGFELTSFQGPNSCAQSETEGLNATTQIDFGRCFSYS